MTKKNIFLLIILIFCIFVGLTLISFLYKYNFILTLVLAAISILVFLFNYKENDNLWFLFGLLFGALGEMYCISFGVWSYTNSSILGIPLWLPFAWGLSILVIRRLVDILKRKS